MHHAACLSMHHAVVTTCASCSKVAHSHTVAEALSNPVVSSLSAKANLHTCGWQARKASMLAVVPCSCMMIVGQAFTLESAAVHSGVCAQWCMCTMVYVHSGFYTSSGSYGRSWFSKKRCPQRVVYCCKVDTLTPLLNGGASSPAPQHTIAKTACCP